MDPILREYLKPSHTDGLWAIGNPKDADCIVTQAFGRNNYLDSQLGDVAMLYHDRYSDSVRVVEGLAWRKFDPGQPNYLLAKRTMELADQYELAVLPQWEVVAAMDLKWLKENYSHIWGIWPPDEHAEKYFSARHVILAQVKLMQDFGWKRPMIVCHPCMVARIYCMFHKLGFEPIVPAQQIADVYDPRSVQSWTRFRDDWIRRERLVRIHHVLKGWV